MERYEKYINEKFYYRHFEIDNITYKLYRYLIFNLYTREKDMRLHADCNYKKDCIAFDGVKGYRCKYLYDYQEKGY